MGNEELERRRGKKADVLELVGVFKEDAEGWKGGMNMEVKKGRALMRSPSFARNLERRSAFPDSLGIDTFFMNAERELAEDCCRKSLLMIRRRDRHRERERGGWRRKW